MTQLLPRLTDMVQADEFTLSVDQELRLLDDRERRSRWWIAPEGTPAPGPRIDGGALVEPWLHPWLQLNDPAADDMVTACVLDEADSSRGILIWLRPTPEALAVWEGAWRHPAGAPKSLGCETNVRVAHPAADYRAVFRSVLPLRQISPETVRWSFARPWPGQPSFDVYTAGWSPRAARRTP